MAAAVLFSYGNPFYEYVSAEELQYSGVTDMQMERYYPVRLETPVELVVNEVYITEGDRVEAGDPLLSFTEESYQNLLDYYTVEIIGAANNLTDIQLTYDQGMLLAENSFELAQEDARRAEFVRDYQYQELEDKIAEYQEVQKALKERISELQNGIAAGSYESSSGGGSGSATGGNSSSGGSSTKSSGSDSDDNSSAKDISETEKEKKSETEPETSVETETQAETESNEESPDTEAETENVETHLSEIKSQLEELDQEYIDTMSELLLLLEQSDTENECEYQEPELFAEDLQNCQIQDYQEFQDSISGEENVLSSLKDIQEKIVKYEEQLELIAQTAGQTDNYRLYRDQLDNNIEQLESGIAVQTEVLKLLQYQESNDFHDSESGFADQGTEDENQGKILEFVIKLQTLDATRTVLVDQLLGEAERLQSETESEITPETEKIPESEKTPEKDKDSQKEEQGNTSERDTANSTKEESEDNQQQQGSQNTSKSKSSGSGGSGSGGSGSGSLTGSEKSTSSDDDILEESSGLGKSSGNGSNNQDENVLSINTDISLFGDHYDLTSVKSKIAKEPSSTEAASELLKQLQDSEKKIQLEYEEILRNKKVTELGIEYQYQTALISGKLADIVYQQEIREWANLLETAIQEKEGLEEEKQIWESFADGTVLSDREGLIAAVNYSEGDIWDTSSEAVDFYNQEHVEIEIEVSQDEISKLQIGDIVTVIINGNREYEGVICKKTSSPEEGTSRTVVNYLVTISVDNEMGRLSVGMSASVDLNLSEMKEIDTGERKSEK